MSRKPEQRIDDIIECCEKILRFTSGMNQEQLVEQELVMDAVLRNIEIIVEEGLVERARAIGGYLVRQLTELAADRPEVWGSVRALGLLAGIDVIARTPAHTDTATVRM